MNHQTSPSTSTWSVNVDAKVKVRHASRRHSGPVLDIS